MSTSSTTIVPGALSFWLPAGPVGIVLLHGYGGSIGDYRAIGEALHECGYSVRGVRLAGHGQGLEALRRSTRADWRGTVEQAVHDTQQHCRSVFLLGSSFGGVLALDYTIRFPQAVTGLILVNTALSYSGGGVFQRLILHALQVFTPYYPKRGLSESERQRAQEVGSAAAWPIQGIFDTADLAKKEIVPKLETVKAPTLIMHSAHDPIVGTHNSQVLQAKLGSTKKDVVALPLASHRPFRDQSMVTFMAQHTQQFIQAVLA